MAFVVWPFAILTGAGTTGIGQIASKTKYLGLCLFSHSSTGCFKVGPDYYAGIALKRIIVKWGQRPSRARLLRVVNRLDWVKEENVTAFSSASDQGLVIANVTPFTSSFYA